MRSDLLHHYRRYRAHQVATYGNSGLHVDGADQRQFTGGGAAYGFHAVAAFDSARSHIHFMRELGKTVRRAQREPEE